MYSIENIENLILCNIFPSCIRIIRCTQCIHIGCVMKLNACDYPQYRKYANVYLVIITKDSTAFKSLKQYALQVITTKVYY